LNPKSACRKIDLLVKLIFFLLLNINVFSGIKLRGLISQEDEIKSP